MSAAPVHDENVAQAEYWSGAGGQRWVDLPGGVRARRRDGKVWFTSSLTKDGGEPVGRK